MLVVSAWGRVIGVWGKGTGQAKGADRVAGTARGAWDAGEGALDGEEGAGTAGGMSRPSPPAPLPGRELCITHIWGRVGELPGFSDVMQALPATPEDFDTGFTVPLAAQEASQLADPAHRLV